MKSNTTESRIREIAIEDIDRSRNHRLPRPGDSERLQAIKTSIEACGQLQPIRVYERGKDQEDKRHKQPYILGFGARRCQALEMLGIETVQAIVYPPATDAEIAQARAVENLHRQDITPLEEVLAVADVLEAIKAEPNFTGDPYEEAAARLGCEPTWVKDRDYLHRLTKPVQRFALRSGLPAGHLRELAKLGDSQEQMRLACDCAGAPPHAFSFDAKASKVEPWQQQLQEQFFAQLADGKVSRWPLTYLKDQVARVQLSLRQIPWHFDQPVTFGATKLRKCAGCPHNSETDRTLFGIDEDVANPQGFCLNPSCFNAKHQVVEAAKEQVLKKIKQKQDQSPAAIRQFTPDWLKDTSVVGFVQRSLEKAKEAPSPSPKPAAMPAEHSSGLSPHAKALQEYAQALQFWQEKAWKAVLKAINSDPVYRVSWCVLLGVHAFYEQPVLTVSKSGALPEPVIPPLSKAVEDAIALAFKGTRNAWTELLAEESQVHPEQRPPLEMLHPQCLVTLAAAMQLKLPAMPVWKPPPAPTVEAQDQAEHAGRPLDEPVPASAGVA